MSALLKPCAGCGELASTAWCSTCKPPKAKPYPKRPRALGYDRAWDLLSRRARKLQPWCTDCGAVEDLTCDHSTRAWERKAAGLPIRLVDVDVVCRSCNGKRGRARPQGGDLDPSSPGTAPLAQVSDTHPPLDPASRPSQAVGGQGASTKGGRSDAQDDPVPEVGMPASGAHRPVPEMGGAG